MENTEENYLPMCPSPTPICLPADDRVQSNNSTGRGQAPQNSKLAELTLGDFQRLIPPILNFAVPDPGQML